MAIDYHAETFHNTFYLQNKIIGEELPVQFERSLEQVKTIIDLPIFKNAKHVIGSGCGDSNLVAFGLKEAFAYFLPDVEYTAMEAIELGRHYDYPEDGSETLALFISVSGRIPRSVEAMKQCQKHGILTIGMTDNKESITATNCDILYHTNSPKGDNSPGLRTIAFNTLSGMVLAAAMAEVRTGKPCIEELREKFLAYHEAYFAGFDEMEKSILDIACAWGPAQKKYIELIADGEMYWQARIVHAKILEVLGHPTTTIDGEDYLHVNQLINGGSEIGNIVLLNSNDSNEEHMLASIDNMIKAGRDVVLFADKTPEELGLEGKVRYARYAVPPKDCNFLVSLYGFLPGSMLTAFYLTALNIVPRTGKKLGTDIFGPSYFAPIDVVEL